MNNLMRQLLSKLLIEETPAEKAKKLGLEWKPGVGLYGRPGVDKATHRSVGGQLVQLNREKPTGGTALAPKATEPTASTGPRTKSTQAATAITAGLVDPSSNAEEMVSQLETSNQKLLGQRKKGVPGPGGAVASYGEIALCDFANELQKEGLASFRKENAASIKKELSALKSIVKGKHVLERRIGVVARELGLDATQDREIVLNYLAARRAYENREIDQLKADKPDGVFYLPAGFNKNEEAVRLWAQAQFDGAIATLDAVSRSPIDTTKPFTVIQSDAKAGGQDQAILAHIQQEMEAAKKNRDVEAEEHYSKQMAAWNKLGFRDTMAVGQDDAGRLTVLHITNKKQNDLADIWNNTTPTEAIDAFRRSYLAKQAGETQQISNRVFKALDLGTQAATANAGDMSDVLIEMPMDDAVATVMHAIESGKAGRGGGKQYLGPIISKRDFQKWLNSKPHIKSTLQKLDASKGINKTKAQLVAIQAFGRDMKSAGKKIPGSHTRILTKVAEEVAKVEKALGTKLNSKGVQACLGVKEREKDLMAAIHQKVAAAILKSDSGYPDAEGNNGPHAQTYIGTVMHAMHFDIMAENYDDTLAAVTGIRGSTPNDFRVCLAQLSGFQSENLNDPAERRKLNDHLIKKSRLNPTTRAIEITNQDGTHVLAEDSWRTSGLSKKVEKKLGNHIRSCVMEQADSRKSSQRQQTITDFS